MTTTTHRILVSGTFTTEPLLAPLAFLADRLGVPVSAEVRGYGQVHQQLLAPASDFAQNQSGLNVALVRWDDLVSGGDGDLHAAAMRAAAELEASLRAAAPRMRVPVALVLGNSSLPAVTRIDDVEAELARRLADVGGVVVVTSAWIRQRYGVRDWYDAAGEKVGHIPYTDAYYAALATTILRVHALGSAPARKVIVLDCDNTLWGGVCGEVGATGVDVEGSWRVLQEFMVQKAEEGWLLCLASKNVESDVRAVFDAHPDMPLRWEHVVAWRIDWNRKSENLLHLADELNLGIGAFVLLDDSPVECGEVRSTLPEVLVLQLPQDPSAIPSFLDHAWGLDTLRVTAEDRRRTELYRQDAERQRARRTLSLAEYLDSLELRVDIAPVQQADVPRAAQLTQRTNQFNTTTIRRTEADMTAARETFAICCRAHVADRYGDYGVVGLLTAEVAGSVLDVSGFMLSCRALGRGVEHRMLAFLGERAQALGLEHVHVRFSPTERNEPAARFLASLRNLDGADWNATAGLLLPSSVAASVRLDASLEAEPDAEEPARTTGAARTAPQPASASASAALHAVAWELRRPESLLRAMSEAAQREGELGIADEPSDGPLEELLRAAWQLVLPGTQPARTASLLEAGGDSIAAARIAARVADLLQVDIPITSCLVLNLGELAVAIERQGAAHGIDVAELARIALVISDMTDAEVDALLAGAPLPPSLAATGAVPLSR